MALKNKLLKKIKIVSIICLILIVSSFLSFAYYTNLNKFYEESRTNDGYNGFSLERKSEGFIENGCGTDTMLDTVTGLCWEKNMNSAAIIKWSTSPAYQEPIWNKSTKSYIWPIGRINTDYPIFNYCNNLTLGENNDWRVPSRDELMTILNELYNESTCSKLSSFGFTGCIETYFWTSDQTIDDTSYAWIIILSNGYDRVSYTDKHSNLYGICVRRD